MNRAAAAGIALLTLLLFPALAGASHGSGPGGGQDFAVGGGTTGDPEDPTSVQHVDFAAKGGPTTTFDPLTGFGDPVTGHFRAGGEFDQAGITTFQQEGPVTCLVVDGRQARLVYPVKRATAETELGSDTLEASEVVFVAQDNGAPENGEPADTVGFTLIPDLPPDGADEDPPSEQDTECAVGPTPQPTFPLRKGNITVHDAP